MMGKAASTSPAVSTPVTMITGLRAGHPKKKTKEISSIIYGKGKVEPHSSERMVGLKEIVGRETAKCEVRPQDLEAEVVHSPPTPLKRKYCRNMKLKTGHCL